MNIAKARRISDPPNTLSLTVACKGGKKIKNQLIALGSTIVLLF